MSKSYNKYLKFGICTGSNTKFYKARRRHIRHKNRHNLQNLLSNYTAEEVSDMFIDFIMFHDNYREPTDGSYLVDENYIKRYKKENGKDTYYKRFEHRLKSNYIKKGKYKRNIKKYRNET